MLATMCVDIIEKEALQRALRPALKLQQWDGKAPFNRETMTTKRVVGPSVQMIMNLSAYRIELERAWCCQISFLASTTFLVGEQ